MPAKILVNRFKEKNFTVEFSGVVHFQAEWNRDTGLSVSVLVVNNDRGYAKNYLEPEEAEAFSKWLNDCLSEPEVKSPPPLNYPWVCSCGIEHSPSNSHCYGCGHSRPDHYNPLAIS